MSATIKQNNTSDGGGLQFEIKTWDIAGLVDTRYTKATLLMGSKSVDDVFMLNVDINLDAGTAIYNLSADNVIKIWHDSINKDVVVNVLVECSAPGLAPLTTEVILTEEGGATGNSIKPMLAPWDLQLLSTAAKDVGAQLNFSVKTSQYGLDVNAAGLVNVKLVISNNTSTAHPGVAAKIQTRMVTSLEAPVEDDVTDGITTWTFATNTGADLKNHLNYEIAANVTSKKITNTDSGVPALTQSIQSNVETIIPSNVPASLTDIKINTLKTNGGPTDLVVSYDCKYNDPDAGTVGSVNTMYVGISDGTGGMLATPPPISKILTPAQSALAAAAATDMPQVSVPGSWFAGVDKIILVSRVDHLVGGTTETGSTTGGDAAYKIITPSIEVKVTKITDNGLQSYLWTGTYGNDENKATNKVELSINGDLSTTITTTLTSTGGEYSATADIPYTTVNGHSVELVFIQEDANDTQDDATGAIKLYTVSKSTPFYRVKTPTDLEPKLLASNQAGVPPSWTSTVNSNGFSNPSFTGAIGDHDVEAAEGTPGSSATKPGPPGLYRITMTATYIFSPPAGDTVYTEYYDNAADGDKPKRSITAVESVGANGKLYYENPTIDAVAIANKTVTITGDSRGANVTGGGAVALYIDANGNHIAEVPTTTKAANPASEEGTDSNFSYTVTMTFTEDVKSNAGSTFDVLTWLSADNAHNPHELITNYGETPVG